jgi:hypothetical protein
VTLSSPRRAPFAVSERTSFPEALAPPPIVMSAAAFGVIV